MNKKLILSEDVEVLAIPVQEPLLEPDVLVDPLKEIQPTANPNPDTLGKINAINTLIKSEWDAIDLYNGMLASLSTMGDCSKCVDVINDIIKEEYIHVGQLQTLLQDLDSNANSIADGTQEVPQGVGLGIDPALDIIPAPAPVVGINATPEPQPEATPINTSLLVDSEGL